MCIFFVSYLLPTIKAVPNILLQVPRALTEFAQVIPRWFLHVLSITCNFHCMYKFYKCQWTQAPWINASLSIRTLLLNAWHAYVELVLSLLYLLSFYSETMLLNNSLSLSGIPISEDSYQKQLCDTLEKQLVASLNVSTLSCKSGVVPFTHHVSILLNFLAISELCRMWYILHILLIFSFFKCFCMSWVFIYLSAVFPIIKNVKFPELYITNCL